MSKTATLVYLLIGLSVFSSTNAVAASVKKENCPKLVIAHWMPQLALYDFNHHKAYRDVPLIGPMQFRGDPVQQMKEAKAYGIDAFAICTSADIGWNQNMWKHSIKAADMIDGFYIAPAICNGPQVANPDRKIMLQASIDWVKEAKGHRSPLRVDGKVVLSSFAWGRTTKEEIDGFRKGIKEATGEDVFIMADVDTDWLNPAEASEDLTAYPVDGVRQIAQSTDMIFLFWPRRYTVVEKTAEISREAGIPFGGAVAPGYWRPETEIWTPFQHTGRLRSLLSSSIKLGATWLNITTWNDFSENHEVQPSACWGDTRASIVKFYGDMLKGRPPVGASRFFVTSPCEARIGIPFKIEALVLQAKDRARQVTVRLVDRKGAEVARWTGAAPASKDSAAYAEFTLKSYPQGRFVRACVDFEENSGKEIHLMGSPINIWPDVDRGLPSRLMFSLSDKSSAQFGKVALSYHEDKIGEGTISVNIDSSAGDLKEFQPWAEVQLLCGDIIVKRILRNEPLEVKWPVENLPIFYRDFPSYIFPHSFRAGFVTPRIITMDGTIAYGDPLWILPSPASDLNQTAHIPMTDIVFGGYKTSEMSEIDHENIILDKSPYSNHLRIAGDAKAVKLIAGPNDKQGLWISPEAKIEMAPNTLPSGPFRMEILLKPDSLDSPQSVLANVDGPVYGGGHFVLSILPGGKLQFIRDSITFESTEGLLAGQWNKVSVGFDGNSVSFKINGRAAGEEQLKPGTSHLLPFNKDMEVMEGRIYPRNRTGVGSTYRGGMADFVIYSGVASAGKSGSADIKKLVSLKYDDIQENNISNSGTLGGVIPLPGSSQISDDKPPSASEGKSLQIEHGAKTSRSTFEIPPLESATVMFWMKPGVTDEYFRNIVDIGKGKLSVFAFKSDIVVRMGSVDSPVDCYMEKALKAGEWVHFAFTFNTNFGSGEVFLNGKSVKKLGVPSVFDGGTMGFSVDDIGAAHCSGHIGGVTIFNSALFQKDIEEMLHEQKSKNTKSVAE